MTYILTSDLCSWETNTIDNANGLSEVLKGCIPLKCRILFICSNPASHEVTRSYGDSVKLCFEKEGFEVTDFTILEGKNEDSADGLIENADLIILAGGHVPTQNMFFRKIGLRDKLKKFKRTLIGISAGTMNSASSVYAQPELEGEGISEDYERFLPGLGITEKTIIPHYQFTKNNILDGLRVFEDITYPDSVGKKFLTLVDGSYLYGCDGREEVRGEAYLISDGKIEKICELNGIKAV